MNLSIKFRVGVTGHPTVPNPGVTRTVLLHAILCTMMAEAKKLAPALQRLCQSCCC
jgi:hypothetical protein